MEGLSLLPIIMLYNSSNTNRGGWDSTGVTTISVTNNTITCNSNHLTSFAVLVDVGGGHGVCKIKFLLEYFAIFIDRIFQRQKRRHYL